MQNMYIIILPAFLTILGNIVFYMFIKGKIDNSIEKQRITFSGVFKEKIDIYKELLCKIYNIKLKIRQYQYFGTDEGAQNIFEEINKFINFYLVNQPFLSINMMNQLNRVRDEFQEVFDKFFMFHKVGLKDSEKEERKKLLDDYFNAGNKLKTNQPFKDIEDLIISEMRKDLHTEK